MPKLPCGHPDPAATAAGCTACRKFTADPRYRAAWGGGPPPGKGCGCKHGACAQLVVSADGVGDHLLGLSVAAAWQRDHPGRHLAFVPKPWCAPWAALFGGYHHLAAAPCPSAEAVHDVAGRGGVHYAETVARLPRERRALPPARPPDADALAFAARHAGAAVLAPTALHAGREWSPSHWLRLESLLLARGVRCVVIGGGKDRDRLAAFRSPRHCGETPGRVAALMRLASVVVGNESGMAHLAGALGVPAVVAAAGAWGARLHEFWPRSTAVKGGGGCDGCSLQGVRPEAVLEAALPHLAGPPTRPPAADPADLLARASAGDFPAAELSALFSPRDAANEDVPTWLARYAVLFDEVRRLAPRSIVEIGVRAGYSSWTMLRASPGASCLAIDLNVNPETGNSHGGYLDAWRHARAINAGHDWRLLVADSHKLERLPECDLVYVDGDHTLDGCRQDLELAERSGARWILVDDYSTPDLEVRAAVDAFVAARPHLGGRFADNGSTGLYVIGRKGAADA